MYTVQQQIDAIRRMMANHSIGAVKGHTYCTAQCQSCVNYDCPISGAPKPNCPSLMAERVA